MKHNNIRIDDFKISFNKTTLRDILDNGYKLDDFFQILVEPTMAVCTIYKGDTIIAYVYFWNIKESVEIEDIYDLPIDDAYLNRSHLINKKPIALKNQILIVLLMNALTFVVLFLYLCLSKSFDFTIDSVFGVVFFIPSIIVMVLCDSIFEIHEKKPLQKLLLFPVYFFMGILQQIVTFAIIGVTMNYFN